ncbi:hypothetical protein [Candidatus Nanoperiomorbus periodonticus]|uniref:hypothetical protein n=1 Tax=Candidatus Nanoperiomorbus periodonticus TaxID=2171989 RepID=UPI00101C68CC|nr:hypothetical protein [Candidatus Nanoperiomorbus periodonticus]RYC76165.1 hypothetical protein G51EAM_00415 [Candidatus Nanoperiomorbus periodonticus]
MNDLIPGRPRAIGRTNSSLGGGINGQLIGVKVRTVAGKRPIDGVTARLGRPVVKPTRVVVRDAAMPVTLAKSKPPVGVVSARNLSARSAEGVRRVTALPPEVPMRATATSGADKPKVGRGRFMDMALPSSDATVKNKPNYATERQAKAELMSERAAAKSSMPRKHPGKVNVMFDGEPQRSSGQTTLRRSPSAGLIPARSIATKPVTPRRPVVPPNKREMGQAGANNSHSEPAVRAGRRPVVTGNSSRNDHAARSVSTPAKSAPVRPATALSPKPSVSSNRSISTGRSAVSSASAGAASSRRAPTFLPDVRVNKRPLGNDSVKRPTPTNVRPADDDLFDDDELDQTLPPLSSQRKKQIISRVLLAIAVVIIGGLIAVAILRLGL